MASTVLPNGIIVPEKFSRDWYADLYHNWQELDNLLGGGTPKDGTLTIQKNGSTVGTFSANQATNETVNIEVPTKTSDLNNDSGFITGVAWDDVTNKPSFATVATSGSYNDLSDKPTIPTVNNATLTIQKNGTDVATFSANSSTNATANITVPTKTSDLTNDSGFITEDNTKIPLAGSNQISGSLIPSTNGTVNLGSPSYQWNQAYIKSLTINGVACGDILTHNASEFAYDADVVHVKGSDDIIDSKTFISLYTQSSGPSLWMKNTSFTMGTAPTTNRYSGLWVQDNDGTDTAYIVHQANKNNSQNLKFSVSNTDGTTVYQNALTFQGRLDGTFNFYSDNPANLGTSTNKWKSFNGINPGALSLPGDTYIDIDTTNYAWGNNFTFTPDYDGYCFINIGTSGNSRRFSLKTGRGEYYFSNQTDIFRFTFPVYKGKLVTILTASSGTESVLPTIRLFPCQGNV